MAEAVLDFSLQVIREAIADGGVDAPDVVAPFRAALFIADRAEELLVPAQRTEKLWSDFVFRFEVVGKSVGIADPRHLEARFEKLRPELEVMPGEGKVLRQDKLVIVPDAPTGRKAR